MIRDCPVPEEVHNVEEANLSVHITLHLSQSNLQTEALGKGVLDSGCSRTVAGKIWYDEYLSTLSKSERLGVKEIASKSLFRFGDGVETKSLMCASVPVFIGKGKFVLDIEIVPNQIPLLISKGAMKQMSMELNFATDTATVHGEQVKLICTSTGHYCLPLNLTCIDDNSVNFVLHLECLNDLSQEEMSKKALKLHRQFSHASKEKLKKLLRDGGCQNREFMKCIDQVCDDCDICLKFRKPPLRPVVGLPLAHDFNEVVCMDLKELENTKLWMLHLIDAATRYSGASLIKTKRAEVIINNVFQHWIRYFGSPTKFLSDNGGEFANEQYCEMNEKLGVETLTTAAESPFSNGMVERHNAVLAETMAKTKAEAKCDDEMALAWAVSSKNSLSNSEGYSANQRVFGKNTNLPSVLTDALPALEPTQSSEMVRKNLEAMHVARQNCVKAEASEKIRRALRHKIRTYSDNHFENGEKVLYKRRNYKGWKGPATVIGEEGKIVLIRHGNAYYRCHPCHLMKVLRRDSKKVVDTGVGHDKNEDQASASIGAAGIVNEDDEGVSTSEEDENEPEAPEGSDNENAPATPNERTDVAARAPVVPDKGIDSEQLRPKRNTQVEFNLDGKPFQAKVLSVQPKRGGKNGNWVNVHINGNDDPSSVNWDDVEEWREVDDVDEEIVLLTRSEELSQEVVDAKEKEILNLIENDVFDEVNDVGQSCVSSKWVVTKKVKEEKTTVKARLVARGFEEKSNNTRTDSPTCSRQSLRMAFVIASTMNWKIQSLDITSAFLQGNGIERNVFLKPPPEANCQGRVWKLKRCIYGLNDAPRAWYERVCTEMIRLGGKASLYDDAMFLWHSEYAHMIGFIVTHVDDFIYAGIEQWHRDVIDQVMSKFKISAHAAGTFRYVGLNVLQTADGIYIDQQAYVQGLKQIEVTSERLQSKDDILSATEKSQLRSLSGQLLWATSQTRPDCAYYSCVVSNYGKEPTVREIVTANKAVKTMKSRDVRLSFPGLGDPKQISVISYSDASHANLPSGASQGGYIVFLCGRGRILPFMWQSKKLNRVTKSPLASETMELADAADAGHLAAVILKEAFALSNEPPVKCLTDSRSLIEHLETSHVIQDSRLRVDVARIREMIQLNECTVKWVEKESQLADPLTKAGASPNKLLEVLRAGRL